MSQYLSEAFKSLDSLNEDIFSVNENGLNDLVKFEEEDEETNIIDIIDAEAETDDDLEDSYEGKIILDCSICHSKQYKNIEDVVIEGDLANVGEECPFCYTNDGFKIVGQVAPFNKDEVEEEPKNDKIEDNEDANEEDDKIEESLNEATATLSRVEGTLGNVLTVHADELSKVYDAQSAIELLDRLEPEISQKDYLKKVKLDIMRAPRKAVNYLYNIILKGDGMGRGVEEDLLVRGEDGKLTTTSQDGRWGNSKEWNYNNEELDEGIFGIKTKKEKEKEAKAKAAKEAQKQRDKELKDQEERARQQSVADSWARYDRAARDAKAEHNRSRDSIKGDKPSNTGYRGVNYSGGDYYSEGLNESIEDVKVIKDCIKSRLTGKNNGGGQNSAYFASWLAEDCGVSYEKVAEVAFLLGYDVYKTASGYFGDADYLVVMPGVDPDIYLTDLDDNTQADWANFKDELTKVESFSSALKESVNNVNVETDEDVINVATDDNGKVTVTTEPKETFVDSEEVITPLEPEVQNEISDNVADGEEIEIDVDEFDEESFDELGESYLKKVYENIDTYKTSQVSLDENTLKVEGMIKFKSGNTKKTSFLFEARTATKTGKVKFIGENTQITKGKKAFTVTGNINNKKFLSESLTYNYGAKTPEGKTKRLYGTIKK